MTTEEARTMENRMDPIGPPPAASSPTGAPFLPPASVPWLVGLVAIAGTLAELLPQHTIGARVAGLVFGLGTLLGLASPGLRRRA